MRLIAKVLFYALLGAMPLSIHSSETGSDFSSVATGSFDEEDVPLLPPPLTPHQQEMLNDDNDRIIVACCGQLTYCSSCVAACCFACSHQCPPAQCCALVCCGPLFATCSAQMALMVCLKCYHACRQRRHGNHHE